MNGTFIGKPCVVVFYLLNVLLFIECLLRGTYRVG